MNMPTISVYVNKETYNKIQNAGDSESKTIQDALRFYFKYLGSVESETL